MTRRLHGRITLWPPQLAGWPITLLCKHLKTASLLSSRWSSYSVSIAALGLATEVQAYFDSEADKLAKAWLAKYGGEIKKLTDDRKEPGIGRGVL
jgi:hypothetical protein